MLHAEIRRESLRYALKSRSRWGLSATQVNGKAARTSVTECPLSASGQRQNGENVSHRVSFASGQGVSFVCLRSSAERRERQSQSPLSASASVCAHTGFLLLTDGRNHCVSADLFSRCHPGTVPDLLRSTKHAPHCLAIFRPEVIVDEEVD